jgi:hypothetical protein
MEQSHLSCCPHCQSKKGYYVKTQIRGSAEVRYTFDGIYDEEHNSDIHDSLAYKEGKYAYCRSCYKRIFKVID